MARVIRKLELAKVGKWGAQSDEITAQDLSDAVETFTANRPVALGHEAARRDDAPRYGGVWSVALTDGGKTLVGDVEFSKELNTLYKSGKYTGWSVSLPKRKKDGKAYFHHLAFLGATPPKIPCLKDLGQVSFNYADGDKVVVHEFSGAIKECDEDISKKEDKMDEEEIRKLQEELARIKAENETLKAEKKELEQKLAAKEKTDEPEVPKEFADKMAGMEAEMQKNRLAAFKAQIAGKIPAGLAGEVEALSSALSKHDSSVDFADSVTSQKMSGTPLELLGSILSKMPQPVETGFSGMEFSDSTAAEYKGSSYASRLMGAL